MCSRSVLYLVSLVALGIQETLYAIFTYIRTRYLCYCFWSQCFYKIFVFISEFHT